MLLVLLLVIGGLAQGGLLEASVVDNDASEESVVGDEVHECHQRALGHESRQDFRSSRETWYDCLQMMDGFGQQSTRVFKNSQERYWLAWYKLFKSESSSV